TRCALPLLLSLLFIYLSHTPPPTSEIYTLSLHDALPISNSPHGRSGPGVPRLALESRRRARRLPGTHARRGYRHLPHDPVAARRSEEHTSELQSRFDLVCRLLLEKKKAATPSCRSYASCR